MTLPLADAAGVLRNAGLNVIELPGWQTRGESDGPFHPFGLLLHHDGEGFGYDTNPNNDMNVPEYMSQNGVNGAQFWVRRDGTWVCLAAGRKWHAGLGQGYGDVPANTGNSDMAGVETDHTVGNPWEKPQFDSIYIGCRALVQHYGWSTRNCCGHKEYAPDRKIDPDNFDLNAWRAYIGSQGSSAGQSAGPAIPPAQGGPVAAEGPLQPAPLQEDIVTPQDVQAIADAVWQRILPPEAGAASGAAAGQAIAVLLNRVAQNMATLSQVLNKPTGDPGAPADAAAIVAGIKAQWAK